MTQRATTWAVWVLFLAVAVLLPAGIMSLTNMEPDSPTAVVSEVGLAGSGQPG